LSSTLTELLSLRLFDRLGCGFVPGSTPGPYGYRSQKTVDVVAR
jgi:hypothetical protein